MIIDTIFNKLKSKKDPAVETDASYRLKLVVKARWFIVGLLVVHGLLGMSAYSISHHLDGSFTFGHIIEEAINLALYPALLVLFIIAYNTFYHVGWYRLPRLWLDKVRLYIFVQLVIDIGVILLLIHFTGGITSWFWPLLLVINLELTYLLVANWQILALGAVAGFGYLLLAALEYNQLIGVYRIPYLPQGLQFNATFVVMMVIWVNLLCGLTGLINLYLNKSEHKELSERIIRDGLTKLYNRRYFNHRLNSEIKRAQRYGRVFSLVMFDIDDFKKFNDTYGHVQGDTLLKWISDIFKLNIRRSDKHPTYELDIACRYGGEEFAVILPETSTGTSLRTAEKIRTEVQFQMQGAVSLAERIRSTIASSRFIYGKGATISAGVSCFPKDGSTEKEIIESADKALYEAKKSGKNKILVFGNDEKPSKIKTKNNRKTSAG